MAVATGAPSEADGSSGPPARPWRRFDGITAGVVAAAVALSAGELVCLLAGSQPTLVTAVGTQFINRFAAALKDLAVQLFGTNDKVALVTGIVIVSLALGAMLGTASARRPLVGVVGFAAFGLVGLLSYFDDPLGEPWIGVVAAIAAAAAGIAVLLGLLHLARAGLGAGPATSPPAGSRRTFLLAAGSLGVLAAGAALLGRRIGRSDVVEAVRADTQLPTPVSQAPATVPASPVGELPDVDGLSAYITPNADFYRIDTALIVPQVDVADWSLRIEGEVDNPFELSFDELVAMADFSDTVTIACVSNEVGGRLVGNAEWQGVPLATLLERARVRSGGTQIVGRSVDGFTAGFPTEIGLDGRTALVAVGMNGEPLPAAHGFPARLIIAGLYGYVSATKWLESIELVGDDFDGYWVPRGWSKEGPIKLQSRIDVPRSGATLTAGRQAIAGVAWQPTLGISRVEVRLGDDGSWQEATLGDATSGNTWVQWYLPWDATPGDHRITVRATNTAGEVQTRDPAPPAPNGATGWHSRRVTVR